MNLAEHFEIPVITLIDTVGAYPSFDSEQTGQSEALATNLLTMVRTSRVSFFGNRQLIESFRLVCAFLSSASFSVKPDLAVLLLLAWAIVLPCWAMHTTLSFPRKVLLLSWAGTYLWCIRALARFAYLFFLNCRYKDEDHKAQQFPIDCRDIANMQKIYAPDLKKRGVIDRILWEYVSSQLLVVFWSGSNSFIN